MADYIIELGVPVAVPDRYGDTPGHRRFRELANQPLKTYEEMLDVLSASKADARRYVRADLLPSTPWARKFVYTTALHLASKKPHVKAQGERGARLLLSLLLGHLERTGRRPKSSMHPQDAQRVLAALARWEVEVHEQWAALRDGGGKLSHFPEGGNDRWLRGLVRGVKRPREIAVRLTAKELGISTRAVRQALRPVDAASPRKPAAAFPTTSLLPDCLSYG